MKRERSTTRELRSSSRDGCLPIEMYQGVVIRQMLPAPVSGRTDAEPEYDRQLSLAIEMMPWKRGEPGYLSN